MAKALRSNYESIGCRDKKEEQAAFVTFNSNRDVVFSILDKLEPIELLRFAEVCKDWLALSKDYKLTAQRWSHQVVPVILTLKEQKLRLYSVCAGNFYDNTLLSVPPNMRRLCGSSHGWLAQDTTHRFVMNNVVIELWNPFDNATASPLCLPSLEGCMSFEVRKVLLLVDPSMNGNNSTCTVAVLRNHNLALFRAGQKDWTFIPRMSDCNDVLLYRSRIYAVDNSGDLWSVEVNHSSKKTRSRCPLAKLIASVNCTGLNRVYIVESSTTGDLLLVQRTSNLQTPLSYSFKIYKLVLDDDGSLVQQVEIKSIGDEAIFVGGGSQSISVFAFKFPGCKPNSIYYTTDVGENPKTVGVFSLQDGTIKQLDPLDGLHERMSLALWSLPQCNVRLSSFINS